MKEQMAHVMELAGQRANRERRHVLEGLTYIFPPGRSAEVPMAVAVKWLIDNESFAVFDADGNRITNARTEPTEVPGSGPIALKANQTVAFFEELTVDSLRARALKHEDFDQDGRERKADIVAFLTAKAGTAGDGTAEPAEEAGDDGTEVEIEHPDGVVGRQ